MIEAGFHFSSPWWLLALLLLLPVAAWLRRSTVHGQIAQIRLYADPALLPYLMGSRELHPVERWRRFRRWALLWVILVLAMAGPRWDFTQVQLFTPGADLIILLDISRSMEVADVRPSRLARAKQEIADLIRQNRGVRIGLIAFASLAHVITPITEDGQAISDLLPSISSNLVRLQGSRLGQALERAEVLLAGQPAESRKSVLLISDGDFVDPSVLQQVEEMAAGGITLHVLGVGSTGGGPVPGTSSRFLLNNQRQIVESRLDQAWLQRLADAGNGVYQTADYRDGDTELILKRAISGSKAAATSDDRVRVWNERFYWLVLPAMALMLPGFRRYRRRDEAEQR